MTAEIVKYVVNENFSSPLIRSKSKIMYVYAPSDFSVILGAARTHFLTLQRRSKQVHSGKLNESQLKQRRTQRKHNVGVEFCCCFLHTYVIIV